MTQTEEEEDTPRILRPLSVEVIYIMKLLGLGSI
jgi:hypothetical protein